jgi:CO/xanthine dehydrogenase FAD-binding subunit
LQVPKTKAAATILYLDNFTYHRPKTLEEACQLLEQCKNGAPIAGGTDVLVEIKKGLRHNDEIVSLKEIDELKLIGQDNSNLYIGAGVTHNEVKNSLFIKEKFPALIDTASNIGTEQIRNTGTIGGNLCTGASCCDMAPVLIAYNSNVEIASSTKRRVVSLKDFFIHHKETSLAKGEIMTKIIVPMPKSGVGVSFLKFGLREAASISVASVSVRINSDGNVCTDSCVVIGAVAPTPRISSKAIEALNNKKLTDLIENLGVLKSIGEAAAKDALPIDDLRGSAEYRKHLVNVLTQRAVITAAKRSFE